MIEVTLAGFVGRYIDVHEMEKDDMSYIGFDGRTVVHSCDDMDSDEFAAGFCGDHLYMITAKDTADRRMQYQGWSYTCDRHFEKLVLDFAATMQNKALDVEYDHWTEEQQRKAAFDCEECGGSLDSSGEPHDHEIVWHEEPKDDELGVAISYDTCRICMCDRSEHNWEAHTAEMRAERNEY